MVDSIIEDAVTAIAQQMDKELRGAWRAGYDYVHVYEEPPTTTPLGRGDLRETFTIRQYILPTNTERPPNPDDLLYRYTYDIAAADDDELREALRDY